MHNVLKGKPGALLFAAFVSIVAGFAGYETGVPSEEYLAAACEELKNE